MITAANDVNDVKKLKKLTVAPEKKKHNGGQDDIGCVIGCCLSVFEGVMQ